MANTELATREIKKTKFKEPKKYNVVVLNDDVTPVDFVVVMLMGIFRHADLVAVELTKKIHEQGRAIVGTYTHEIAEQKHIEATHSARTNGYPLVIRVEAE